MSNVLTNTNTEIYRDLVVSGFRKATAPMREIFVTDASPAPAERGALVKVLTMPSGSEPTAFVASSGFTVQSATRVGVDVSLDNYYYNSSALTGKEINDSSLVNITQLAQVQAIELANTVFYDHLNFVSASATAYGTTFASASSLTVNSLVDIRTAAVGTYKWNGPAYLILNSTAFGALLKDSGFQAQYRGQNDVQTGVDLFRSVRNVLGWNAIFEAPSIPFTPAAAPGVIGYAVTPRCLASAMRWWKGPEGGSTVVDIPITDPETGITLGYREIVQDMYDRRVGVWTALWGKNVTLATGALILKASSNT
jgi:hypothetical protein